MNKLVITIAMILIIIASLVGWYYGRMLNYRLSYQDMVKETILEMVKEECIK